MDTYTFNGSSTTPIDTRYGGEFNSPTSFSAGILYGIARHLKRLYSCAVVNPLNATLIDMQAALAPPVSTAAPPQSLTAAATALAALPS